MLSPPSAPQDATGLTVGLVFAGLGATVIGCGAIYLAKGACYELFCECGSSSSGDEVDFWMANGSFSSVEALTPQQVRQLRHIFQSLDSSGKWLARTEPHLNDAALWTALTWPLGKGNSVWDTLEGRERDQLFAVADRRGCGRVNFEDYCHILVRIKLEGANAVVTSV